MTPEPPEPIGDPQNEHRLKSALCYAVNGWHVFPCNPQTKTPLTDHGFKDASTDVDQVRMWWTRQPDALIGFWPGPSDLAVLDIDMKNGKDGLAGLSQLTGRAALPLTPAAHTPSGGYHIYFRQPKNRITTTVCNPASGLDWRGDGAYVIVPARGTGYRWGEYNFDNCNLLTAPAELMPKSERRTRQLQGQQCGAGTPPRITGNGLNGALHRLLSAEVGERNNLLFWTSNRFAEGVRSGLLTASDAQDLLCRAASEIGLTEREAGATIDSAFTGL